MENQNIPIDINSGKLMDWLINRRHCKLGWQTQIVKIREKINNAIQDMPAHEGIVKLLSGTYINYFHCQKIINILKETEADTKNLFGRYGSQRMKDWQEIVKLYEIDNIYLAEVAQMLIRNVSYEIPSIKKQVQKLEQSQKEIDKKCIEYKKSENSAHQEFQNMCKNLKIEGKNIKKELVDRVVELPEIYYEVVKKCLSLSEAAKFYSAFVYLVFGRYHDGGCVPMIQYVIDKGNTTTYQWIYGEEPLSIDEPAINIDIEEESSSNIVENIIDYGEPDIVEDFHEEVNLNESGEIDWGDIGVVDDGIEALPDVSSISLEESGIVVEDAGHEGGVATGTEALRILDNPKTRDEFIDQLYELEVFFKLRFFELKNQKENDLLNITQMPDVPAIIQLASKESIQNMLDNVQIVLSTILDSRVQHLHHIKHSPRYVDMLTESLKQKLEVMKKMEAMRTTLLSKKEELSEQIKSSQSILKVLVQRTKELQADIEEDISKKYNSRVVRLTGGINTI